MSLLKGTEREVSRAYVMHATMNLVTPFLGVVAFSAVAWERTNRTQHIWWIAYMLFAATTHVITAFFAFRTAEQRRRETVATPYLVAQALLGIGWGAAVLLEGHGRDPLAYQLLVALTVVASSASIVISFAAIRSVGYAALVPMWLTMMSGWIVMGNFWMALLCFGGMVIVLGYFQAAAHAAHESRQARRELRASRDEQQYQANHDELTGLWNRSGMLGDLEQRLATQAIGLFFIDLDGFKEINDSRGHEIGDLVLREIGCRLYGVAPTGLVGRLGGDEFVIAIESPASSDEVDALGRGILDVLSQPLTIDDIVVSASVGTIVAERGTSADQALSKADLAMYQSKSEGGGTVIEYTPEFRVARIQQIEQVRRVRQAVERDHLHAVGQPLVDLMTREWFGIEMLVRWPNCDSDPVSVPKLISIIETHGLEVDLGRMMLRRAAELVSYANNPTICTGVNISVPHLLSGTLSQDVLEATREAGVDPARVVIEITESQPIDDLPTAVREMQKLRDMGMAIALDDFGTGFSSFAMLHELPVTSIKLAPEMCLGLHAGGRRAVLIKHIVAMVNDLGLTMIAEGIEDEATVAALLEAGVNFGQGFLFSKPRPIDELRHAISVPGNGIDRLVPAAVVHELEGRTA